jgi:chemotaxis protein histidine kinase CheA
MLNGNEWHQLHSEFLSDSQALLTRSDECLAHLELISDDKDAIEGLLDSLQKIAGEADKAHVAPIASFARQLRYLLYFAHAAARIHPKTLESLRRCFSLLAWQVELIDPESGELLLDDQEQQELLEHFGCCSGIGTVEPSPVHPVRWTPSGALQAKPADSCADGRTRHTSSI